jgi:hypothetical protein
VRMNLVAPVGVDPGVPITVLYSVSIMPTSTTAENVTAVVMSVICAVNP